MSEPETEAAIVRREVQRAGRLEDSLPNIGEWFWVKVEEDPEDTVYISRGRRQTKKRGKKRKAEPSFREHLMCVEHVASNHVQFTREEGEYSYTEQIGFQQLMTHCRPEPNWKAILEERMEEVRQAIQAETRKLYDDAQKANALPPTNTQFVPTEAAPFALAIRTLDPSREKARLLRLQKKIPLVVESIEKLAKKQAGLAKMLMLSELSNLYAMEKKLRVVQDKIFTLEVYAGLQEKVKQIGDGKAAGPDTKITVRQSLLFMDEESLIDFDKGGMDFRKLSDFDEWVAKPESLARVLPEPRGIVAFRVRRNEKDYGIARNIFEAWAHFEMQKMNWKTYLLIRNGEKVYRIASAVDFQPRLIPLKNEFDDAFTEEHRHTDWNHPDRPTIREVERITPDNFEYDEHAEKLRDHLKQYNRVVVLLQGLLDRSECFHPHPPINLANEHDMAEWLNLIRDEEDALEAGTLLETWEQYRDRCNATLQPGDFIFSNYDDGRRRPHDAKPCPDIIQVSKIRLGTKKDIVQPRYEERDYRRVSEGRPAKFCVGLPGVEVEWDGGDCYRWSQNRRRNLYATETHYRYTGRMWIPMTQVFNLMEYKIGDYKRFLCDRRCKAAYLEWAPELLNAERWHQKMSKL